MSYFYVVMKSCLINKTETGPIYWISYVIQNFFFPPRPIICTFSKIVRKGNPDVIIRELIIFSTFCKKIQ